MRDDDILPSLKQERDYRIFCNGAESFINRWAPSEPWKRVEFTAGLMGLFREMIITQQTVHQEVAARYFKQSMDFGNMLHVPPIIKKTESES